ncbi:MAG: DUF4332 domain-containing protein [Bacteroidetes bacterium]|nr:DUF4332 domain-containing protein [Bacteroidota bacterium]MCL1968969.1 DUF4332 domain-containing protein [Bacteroidota bacterium]
MATTIQFKTAQNSFSFMLRGTGNVKVYCDDVPTPIHSSALVADKDTWISHDTKTAPTTPTTSGSGSTTLKSISRSTILLDRTVKVKNVAVNVKNVQLSKDVPAVTHTVKIEATTITHFTCENSGLTELSGLPQELTRLVCNNNQLKSLNLTGLINLTFFQCNHNNLTSLNVSALTALTDLYCEFNQLTNLIVGSLANLKTLYCNNNKLTSLDISTLSNLKILACSTNPLTKLDVSNNSKLIWLFCYENQLKSIDVSKHNKLTILSCYGNQLTSLDISKNTALFDLQCYDNQLTSLTVGTPNVLTCIMCNNNKLNAEALNKLFEALNTIQSSDRNYRDNRLEINGNPGTDTCGVQIATGKGWDVNVRGLRYPLPTMGAIDDRQIMQKNLYIKLANIGNNNNGNIPFNLLKNNVQNKKLKPRQRISKAELLVAQEYFEDLGSGKEESDPPKWHSECRFEIFGEWFNLKVIGQLLELFEIKLNDQNVGSSLIPIKGISKIMQAKLRPLGIYDTAGLLIKGKTQKQRDNLADKLEVNVKLVNTWVKQADLWRVQGMTTDMAYLLVQLGIRNAEDLSKIDSNKVYPILQSLVLAQSDFNIVTKDELEKLIEEAEHTTIHACINEEKLFENLIKGLINAQKPDMTDDQIEAYLNDHKNQILNASRNPSLKSNIIETDDDEPQHLFSIDHIPVSLKTSGTIIRDGLAFLDKVPLTLPLPYAISGKVVGEQNSIFKNGYPNLLVEITGISSSVTDKTEKEKTPSAHTDGNGNFRIILPEKLNLQEGITITASNGGLYKQTFLMSASDIIDAVPQQKILNKYYELQAILSEIMYKETSQTRLNMLESDLYLVGIEKTRLDDEIKNLTERIKVLNGESSPDNLKVLVKKYPGLSIQEIIENIQKTENFERNKTQLRERNLEMANWIEEKCRIEREIESIKKGIDKDSKVIGDDKKEIWELEEEYNTLKYGSDGIITKSKPHSTDLEIILRNLVSSNNKYEAKLEEPFVIIRDIFEGDRTGLAKALPSVKLMGDDENAIHLPTDTAPSRIFNYGMLQRLIEPELGPVIKVRKKLSTPVNVMEFKEKLYTNPHSYPQMSSLGIGYVLNMHQAWVPNGFALGSLLYSLVLAPGEEQRLIVRENKQAYTISNEAMGIDTDTQSTDMSQVDDSTAAFSYAMNRASQGSSNYDYSARTESGSVSAGLIVVSGNYADSTSRGSGSSSSRQSDAHNEAATTAQHVQHNIKSASDRISQSKRISIRTATSEENESVATKIIANHNHSHAMTIQYWEVMRRFRLETCIDGIELVLFVPLQLIKFIPNGKYSPDLKEFDRKRFLYRYEILLKYADKLQYALPYKYRTGLTLIKKYAAMPNWTMEKTTINTKTITLTFNCVLLSCDDLTATLILKNGKGVIAGDVDYSRLNIPGKNDSERGFETTSELKQWIRKVRNKKNYSTKLDIPFVDIKIPHDTSVTCSFIVPSNITNDDLSYISLNYSCEEIEYTLYQNDATLSNWQKDVWKNYVLGNPRDVFKSFPEAYRTPVVTLYSWQITNEGYPIISNVKIEGSGGSLTAMPASNTLRSSLAISIANNQPVLRYSELQEIESTMHHIASDTLRYSQVIWASLSDDERAMLLEQYTIDMDFGEIQNIDVENNKPEPSPKLIRPIIPLLNKSKIDIPLLNCVNVKKMLGFYGNCILLPFTYPKELAKKLGKTAAEIQDALYRYHTNSFRVPTTTISLPTDGMIGEAVLGETNVSEVIDLTRFWNWQDSPIDKMELNKDFLNSKDYLADKTAAEIAALHVQGATAPASVPVPDLIKTLADKTAPGFKDITGLDQLKDVLNAGTESASKGRDKALEENTKFNAKLIDGAVAVAGMIMGKETKGKSGDGSGDGSGGGSGGGNKQDGGGNKQDGGGNKQSGSGTPQVVVCPYANIGGTGGGGSGSGKSGTGGTPATPATPATPETPVTPAAGGSTGKKAKTE